MSQINVHRKDTKVGSSNSGDTLRRLLLILVMIGFTALVASRFTNARNLVETLSRGDWQWVTLGVVIHLFYFGLYAGLYHFGFSTVGVQSNIFELIPLVFASVFVNAVAPAGGAGGAALFINYTVQRGQSGARTAVGLALVLLSDLATLIPFLFFGIAYLYIQHDLPYYETLSALIFLFCVVGLMTLLGLARWKPAFLRLILSWIQRAVNWIGARIKHPNLLAANWAEKNAQEFQIGAEEIGAHPKELTYTLIWATFLHVVNLIGLYTFFLAFQQPVPLGALVAGFGLGIVFFIISIIPQGIGAVEGIMTLVFTSLGIPRTKAIVIALSFRGVNFWLPLVLGLLFLQRATFVPPSEGAAAVQQAERDG